MNITKNYLHSITIEDMFYLKKTDYDDYSYEELRISVCILLIILSCIGILPFIVWCILYIQAMCVNHRVSPSSNNAI